MIKAESALRRVEPWWRVRLASQEEQNNRIKDHSGCTSISSHNRYPYVQWNSGERKRTSTTRE